MDERKKFTVFQPLLSKGVRRSYAKKRTILFQGEVPRGVMIIDSGLVKVYGITSSGDQRTVTLLGLGDIFPMSWVFDKSEAGIYYYEALTDCTILIVPKDDYKQALKESPEIKDHVLIPICLIILRQLCMFTRLSTAMHRTNSSIFCSAWLLGSVKLKKTV